MADRRRSLERSVGRVAQGPTVSVRFVWAVVRAAERVGVPKGELLRAARIGPAELKNAEARLPRADLDRIFELALDLTGDPALGLHVAEGFEAHPFAPLSQLINHAASLRQAFESLHRFQGLLADDSHFELCEHDDEVSVRCRLLPGQRLWLQRFRAEMPLTSLVRLVDYFANARPERVSFEHAAPPYRSEYARVFKGAECFEQPFTGIVLDRALLDARSPDEDVDAHEALRALAEHRSLRLNEGVPYALRVREFLVQHGSPRWIDMETIARSFGLSVRSLRRRLASEGKSYHAIENEAFAILAKRLLRDEQRTIQETAYELGFSDTTTFHRAFKRWTGTTPSAYQKSG